MEIGIRAQGLVRNHVAQNYAPALVQNGEATLAAVLREGGGVGIGWRPRMIHMSDGEGDFAVPNALHIGIAHVVPHSSGRCLVTITVSAQSNPDMKWSFETLHECRKESDIPAAIQASKRDLAETFSKIAKALSESQLPALVEAPK